VTAVHSVISLAVPDDRLDGLPSFEQSAFIIGQPLIFAPVFDLNSRVVIIHILVAQVGTHHLWLDAQSLHRDGALLDLLMQLVPVIRVALKAPCIHDQIALERHSQTDLHTKFVGVTALSFGDALYLGLMPVAELCAVIHRFAVCRLRDQAFGLVQDMTQDFLHRLAQNVHLATYLALQPPDVGALAFDDFSHAFELAGMGLATSLVAQQLAYFGVGLLEFDAIGLGGFNHFD
jgi:hypothetical protein